KGTGGAIDSKGDVTLTGGTVAYNHGSVGGGIGNEWGGTMTISGTALNDNVAPAWGGAVFNDGVLGGDGATFAPHSAGYSDGGGIFNRFGTLTVRTSTFTGNSAGGGAGISNTATGSMTVESSSFSGNSAFWAGGAIVNGGIADLINLTASGNSAPNWTG